MGSSRGRRSYKPRGRRSGGRSSGTSSPHRRHFRPRMGRSSAFNRFRSPRHHRNHGAYIPVNSPHGRGPIPQGDGTWYDPETGEYFRKESLGEMLKRWFSFFSPGSK